MTQRCSVCCILPPYILEKLSTSESEELRRIAHQAQVTSAAIRAQRRVFVQMGDVVANPGEGKRRTIFDCRNLETTMFAVRRRGENDAATNDNAVNEAFEGVGTTYDFFKEVFRRESLDDRGMRLNCYVHYGKDYANAFWDGRQMLFGDGDGKVFTRLTMSMDIVAHELTHGVTQYAGNLEYLNQPGALNESVSDVFGSLVKQWKAGQTAEQADWLIGADSWTPLYPGDALRSMKSPGTAFNNKDFGKDPQPAHMDDYVELPETEAGDWGGVHINSGIPNHAFYLVATGIGGYAWEKPGTIWYEALHRCRKDTDFASFANITLTAARELYPSDKRVISIVRDAWEQVGVSAESHPGFASEKQRQPGEPAVQTDIMWAIKNLASQIDRLQDDVNFLKTGAAPFGKPYDTKTGTKRPPSH